MTIRTDKVQYFEEQILEIISPPLDVLRGPGQGAGLHHREVQAAVDLRGLRGGRLLALAGAGKL